MPPTPLLLGIDIGGAGAKAALFTAAGSLVAEGYGEYATTSLVPGQAEQDAEEWWRATVSAIRQTLFGRDPQVIAAIGVGCTNGLVAVDAAARPLRPAVTLWDQRSAPQVGRIREVLGEERVFEVTGNPVAPGAYSLPILLWLRDHDPATFAAARSFLVPGGYLVARLTGEHTIDVSRASTTLLFDLRARRWHASFFEALGVPPEKLPRVCDPEEIAGTITAGAAAETGLAPGTPVLAGCMDTLAASLGSGMLEPGETSVILGTAARVSCPLGEPRFDRRFMNCAHLRDGRWLAIGALSGVGSSLRWMRDTLGEPERRRAAETGADAYDLLTAAAAGAPPGSKGLLYLPYLAGERTPIWDPQARGVFFGLTLSHRRSDLVRAVLEGAGFAIRQAVEVLERAEGRRCDELRIGGAAARSAIWCQILADVLGRPLRALTRAHTEVLGAALIAGVASGTVESYRAAFATWVETGRRFEPGPAAHQVYDRLFPIYEGLYPSLRPHFQALGGLDLPAHPPDRHEGDER